MVDKLEQYKFEPTNQDLIKAIKVFKPTNEKKCFSVSVLFGRICICFAIDRSPSPHITGWAIAMARRAKLKTKVGKLKIETTNGSYLSCNNDT